MGILGGGGEVRNEWPAITSLTIQKGKENRVTTLLEGCRPA